MNWYEKLSEYFPIEEMKSKAHMEALLKERSDIYHKDEGKHHILMFAEFDSFIFVDYLYVSKDARGQGLGGKLIDHPYCKRHYCNGHVRSFGGFRMVICYSPRIYCGCFA